MSRPSFQELTRANWAQGKLVCVGLDPDLTKIPGHIQGTPAQRVEVFLREIVAATADVAAAYKPNMAFFEAMGIDGLRVLSGLVPFINAKAPRAVVIGDGKRNDIGNTAMAYARAYFLVWGFDAGTVNPYLGGDSLEPFFAHQDKGVFVLCHTSNPGAENFQDMHDPAGVPLYQRVAMDVREWDKHKNCGLVMGATFPAQLAEVRKIVGPGMPLLLPGVGAQGADLEQAIAAGTDEEGNGVFLNVSRSVLYADKGPGFADAARAEVIRLNTAIKACVASKRSATT